MNAELNTAAYLKAAQYAGTPADGMNEMFVAVILVGLIFVAITIVSMIVYDIVVERINKPEDTYNNKL